MVLNNVFWALASLLAYDGVFLLVLVSLVALLAGTKQAAFAVMKRNFVGYFSNPTGYVFLCIFVFLTSLAAFWPYEFFNQNLATLDQLNFWYPLIMLVFIPAITMSIWAEEKRQGTDELLLTLPADDFDIVIGKYMAASSIFTASLVFSQLSTFITLAILTQGGVDTGLIFTTYLGYWFVGLTMIAIGMIASFLTGNLTVGFVLGALFNAPLAFASLADSVSPTQKLAAWLAAAGIARPFDDFGRGVISSSSMIYFVFVASVALYVCMVLIGRRHWTGGKDGNTMAWHYIARAFALIAITCGSVIVMRNWDVVRFDATENKVSSLAGGTRNMIANLEANRPIVIDAFISSDVPELYARTRYELINLLKEFRSEAAKNNRKIEVNLYDNIELFSEEAALAAERFGIEPVTRLVREKGSFQQKQLIMGAAFRSGLEKVTVPAFEYGIPVEYELVRSINTVARGARKRVGIVATDAQLMGGMSMQGMQMQRIDKHPLVDELAKQYDVEVVDLNGPVSPDMYDALIAVQPSSLAPPMFERLVAAVNEGVPVAIFEDPFPFAASYITPTGEQKQAQGGMFGGGGAPQPKGDIRMLWDALGLEAPGRAGMQGLYSPDLVWQAYNPYPNLDMNVNELWVFVDEEAPGVQKGQALSNDNIITSGLREVLTLYTGAIRAKADTPLKHTPLMRTGELSGLITFDKVQQAMSGRGAISRLIDESSPGQIVAISVEGAAKEAAAPAEGEEAGAAARGVKAVYVADTDIMLPVFLQLRAEPDQATDMRFQFQNVTFLLNTIDWLTGETEFIDVRKHEPNFASLKMIDAVKEEASTEVRQQVKVFQDEKDAAVRDAEEKMQLALKSVQEDITKLQKENADGRVSQAALQEKVMQFQIKQESLQRLVDVKKQSTERELERNTREIQRQADQQVTAIQNQVKAFAVALPCIPPLIIGVIVFASRRLRERENISKSRLK